MYKRVLTFVFSILLCSSAASYAAGVKAKYSGSQIEGCTLYQLGMDEFVITLTGKKLPKPHAETDDNSLVIFFDGARANNPDAITSSMYDIIDGVPVLVGFKAENLSGDQVSVQIDATMPLELIKTSRTARGWSFRVKAQESQKLLADFPTLSPKPTAIAPQTELPFTANTRTTIEFRDAEL